MGKLIKEAAVDDRFNVEMKKIQTAIDKLRDLVPELKAAKAVASQKSQLRNAATDLKSLFDAIND